MSSMLGKCAICNRTAYDIESFAVIEKVFHKGCFKCAVCKQSLNMKNYKSYEGKIYCQNHCPTRIFNLPPER